MNTELVRHVVREKLNKHPDIDDPDTARSISTKLADPRLNQVDFSPEPLRSLANIVAESMKEIDWEQTNISDEGELYEELLESILEVYNENKPTERDSGDEKQRVDSSSRNCGRQSEDETDIIEGDAAGIGAEPNYYGEDSDGTGGPVSSINGR